MKSPTATISDDGGPAAVSGGSDSSGNGHAPAGGGGENPPEGSPRPRISKIKPPRERTYNVRLFKEGARTLLAVTFAFAFLFTLIASFIGSVLGHAKWDLVKDWLLIILPAETGLFGSALGFYFGASGLTRADSDDD